MRLRSFCAALSLLCAGTVCAQTDWIPCTDADRGVRPDTALGSRDAVVILHRVVAEDGNLGKSTRTIFYRVKVFTSEGMKLGDVSIPFIRGVTEVTSIAARVILPDGQIQEVSQDRIHEEDLFEADEVTVGRKAFSIPGIVVGSIIDYRFTVESKGYHYTWTIGGDLPVLRGEYDWKPYEYRYSFPNFAWINLPSRVTPTLKKLPTDASPEEFLFAVENLPVLRHEPYMMPPAAVTPQLVCYYAGRKTPAQYWKDESQDYLMGFDSFLKKNDGAMEIASSLAPGKPTPERIKAAYEWVQSNFRNTSVEDTSSEEEEEEMASSLEELLERRSGSSVEINLALVGVLRALNVTTDLCLAVDNRRSRFNRGLKYWQFDRTLVRATPDEGGAIYMTPDEPLAPFGMVPWYLEGTEVIVPGYDLEVNFILPPSPPGANATTRVLTILTADSLDMLGHFSETITGQGAVAMMSELREKKGMEREDLFRDHIRESFPEGEIDSLTTDPGNGTSSPVLLSCSIVLPPLAREGKDRMIFRPFTTLGTRKNPFVDPRRDHAVTMEYARLDNDEVRLPIPPGWRVQEPIAEDLFGGKLGTGVVRGRISGDTLIVSRAFTLKVGFWEAKDYRDGQDLFRRLEASKEFSVVLTRTGKGK
jgi:hypothetical protein